MPPAQTTVPPGPQAPASPNFAFLASYDPALVRVAAQAERLCFDDPNTSLIKSRQLCELLARHAAARVGITTTAEQNQVESGLVKAQRGE